MGKEGVMGRVSDLLIGIITTGSARMTGLVQATNLLPWRYEILDGHRTADREWALDWFGAPPLQECTA